jgi:hypothetical protein
LSRLHAKVASIRKRFAPLFQKLQAKLLQARGLPPNFPVGQSHFQAASQPGSPSSSATTGQAQDKPPKLSGLTQPPVQQAAVETERLPSPPDQADADARLRRSRWLRLTGLLPPEERGFTPRMDGDERPPQLDPECDEEQRLERMRRQQADQEYVEPYPMKPKWSLPATPDDAPPFWDNVVRAYEEDR